MVYSSIIQKKVLRPVLVFLVLVSCTPLAYSKTTDFDIVCGFFNDLSKSPNIDTMSPQQKADYVNAKIASKLQARSNARLSWGAVQSAASHQRYELFKYAADETLSINWECAAMKQLAATTGE